MQGKQMEDTCENCSKVIKDSVFKSNNRLDSKKIKTINLYETDKKTSYCDSCGTEKYLIASERLGKEKSKLKKALEKNITSIPILTTHHPQKWEYESLGVVTGQSTTGTGIVSEFTSSFTDFFGAQSGAFNKKLSKGENLCFAQLRLKAIQLGGNAIIATDIDYAEMGSLKGMLMVCASGTAIRLNNLDILGPETSSIIKEAKVSP